MRLAILLALSLAACSSSSASEPPEPTREPIAPAPRHEGPYIKAEFVRVVGADDWTPKGPPAEDYRQLKFAVRGTNLTVGTVFKPVTPCMRVLDGEGVELAKLTGDSQRVRAGDPVMFTITDMIKRTDWERRHSIQTYFSEDAFCAGPDEAFSNLENATVIL